MANRGALRILTNVLAPYQRDLFLALAPQLDMPLTVHLMADNEPRRDWKGSAGSLGSTAVLHPGHALWAGGHVNPGVAVAVWRSDPHDVWVLTGSYLAPSVILARLVLGVRRRAWVLWGERPTPRLLRAKALYLRWFLRGSSGVWAVSSRGARWYGRLTAQPVRVFPYATRHNEQEPRPTPPGEGPRRLLFCGQLIERKRPQWLLEAAAQLDRDPPVEVRIIGVGPLESTLREQAEASGVRTKLLGSVSREEVLAEMAAASALVLPATYEGWGMVVTEALSCGTPVVATPGVDSATELAPSTDAVVVAEDSVKGVAEAIRRALEPALQHAATEPGVLAFSSVEAVAAGMAAAVRDLRRSGPAAREALAAPPPRTATAPTAPQGAAGGGQGRSGAAKAAAALAHLWRHPSNRGRGPSAVARYARFQLRGRVLHRPTVVRLGRRSSVVARIGEYGSTRAVHGAMPDYAEFLAWERLLRPGDVFIDGGANVGVYSVWCCELGAQVVAVEPSEAAGRAFRQNLALNGYTAELHQAALSDHEGTVRFTAGLDTQNRVVAGGAEEVQATTLDALIGEREAYVKLDLEGGELAALRGAEAALRSHRIKALQIEWTDRRAFPDDVDPSRRGCKALLESFGYTFARPDLHGVLQPVPSPEPGADVFAIPASHHRRSESGRGLPSRNADE